VASSPSRAAAPTNGPLRYSTANRPPDAGEAEMTKPTVSAFRWVPPFAQGLVRDLRVRWALEEAGIDYDERLIGPDDQQSPAYRAWQPFGQVPAIEDGGVVLFESGAIVLHVAERCPALLPVEAPARARVKTWMFAALNSVEPPIMMLNVIDMQADGEGASLRPKVVALVEQRLDALAAFLGDREQLVGDAFSAADLLMASVLRILRTTDLVAKRPALDAYRRRAEDRPAFGRALSAQLAAFAVHAPPPEPAG
jgi:glutathione S-transferase